MVVDLDTVRAALAEELDTRNRIDAETHKVHHDYVSNLIECSRRRREIFDATIKQAMGWGFIAALAWFGLAVYESARSALH